MVMIFDSQRLEELRTADIKLSAVLFLFEMFARSDDLRNPKYFLVETVETLFFPWEGEGKEIFKSFKFSTAHQNMDTNFKTYQILL